MENQAGYLWKDYHLTPRGWIGGSFSDELDRRTEIEPPKDRLETIRLYKADISNKEISRTTEGLWTNGDYEQIHELRKKFRQPWSI